MENNNEVINDNVNVNSDTANIQKPASAKKKVNAGLIIGIIIGALAIGAFVISAIILVILFVFGRASGAKTNMAIEEVEGKVTAYREDRDTVEFEVGDPVFYGDIISTSKKGTVTIKIDEDKYIKADPKTEFIVTRDESTKQPITEIYVTKGTVVFEFKNGLSEGDDYIVSTEFATATVDESKSKFSVNHYSDDELSYIEVSKGRLHVESDKDYIDLEKGEGIYARGKYLLTVDEMVGDGDIDFEDISIDEPENDPEDSDDYGEDISESYEDYGDTMTIFDYASGLSDAEKSAYREYLSLHNYDFGYYYWQFEYENGTWGYEKKGDNPIVAFWDVNGDDKKEMLVLRALSYDAVDAYMEILGTGKKGKLKELGSFCVDVAAAGGTGYIVYVDEANELYCKKTSYDEGSETSIVHLEFEDGVLSENLVAGMSEFPSDDYSSMEYSYYDGGYNEITAEEYEDLLDYAFPVNSMTVLFYNSLSQDEVNGYADQFNMGIGCMTAPEAMRVLSVTEEVADGELPLEDCINLTFASGVGGWSTDMTLYKDGSFSGLYHDSDMGVTGDGYPCGTLYYCEFDGKFKNIEKLDEDTYCLELDYINYVMEPGRDEIMDETHYIYTDAYGLSGGEVFHLYLPGTYVEYLPEEYVNWVWDLASKLELPNFGLFNTGTGDGFLAY